MNRNTSRRVVSAVVAAAGLAAMVGFAVPAVADDHWWHDDIHRFHEHDVEVWRHGRWFHGDHLGRAGWWWIVGGVWYFYPAPIYPYPDPYVPPAAVAPAVPQYYYWCAAPRGYYPQVPGCSVPWQAVPATAPVTPPTAMAPSPAPAPAPAPPPGNAVAPPPNTPPPPPTNQ